ncbi:MAG TPA: hypothetical protein VNT79_07910, partial [Phycisphaerae bacterium]|nr:hypothetical protein [Phycisphaerae bacterium]
MRILPAVLSAIALATAEILPNTSLSMNSVRARIDMSHVTRHSSLGAFERRNSPFRSCPFF